MADVEVGFRPVLGHKYFTVLEGVHQSGINVEVWVKFLHHHVQAAGAKKHT